MDNSVNDTINGILQFLNNKVSPEGKQKVLEALKQKTIIPQVAEVITAVPVNQGEKREINNFILKQGFEEKDIEYKIDKKILGGIKIRLGDNLIDRSFSRVLSKLQDNIGE